MKSIKIPLYFGSIYFLLIAVTHAIDFKIPGLFIYYNVPAHAYQNKIISLFAFGWSAFFYTTASHLTEKSIKTILIIGAVAIGMLTFVNINTNFSNYSETINPMIFHIETGVLFIYWLWLFLCYIKSKKNR
jgi:hypothetical protein